VPAGTGMARLAEQAPMLRARPVTIIKFKLISKLPALYYLKARF